MVDANLLIIILVVVFVVVVVCSLLYCLCWGRLCACCTRRKRARHGYAGLHGGGTVIHIHNEDSDARQQRQQLLDEVRALRGDEGEPPDLSQLRTEEPEMPEKEPTPVQEIRWFVDENDSDLGD